jgi:16S rRNA (guanine1207-N2)-methyltransferase
LGSSKLDPVLEALATELQNAEGTAIWLADEQSPSPQLERALLDRQATYVSNRIDQVESMQRKGIAAEFHDFDFRPPVKRFDHLFVRVPKQRALVHHFFNLAADILKPGGCLWIAGQKNEGIKTHINRAEARLGAAAEKIKLANAVGLYRITPQSAGPSLNDEQYSELRQVEMAPGVVFWSKPGVYGWNKIDPGSRALVKVMQGLFSDFSGSRVLDLGCGYGFLASEAQRLEPDLLVASDNHAGAILAAEKNLPMKGVKTQVIAADCGSALNHGFDVILCNPPFHRGFSITTLLHQKFLTAIARLLAQDGRALVVLNSFLKIDRLCQEVGLSILQTWHFDEDNFTVFEIAKRGSA